MMRRPHKKSRYGCKPCKQRHIKCDETRPACANCVITRRQCSYLALHGPDLRSRPLSRPAQSVDPSANLCPPTPVPSVPSPQPGEPPPPETSSSSPRPSIELGLLSEGYGLMHLELLHHFEHKLSLAFTPFQPDVEPVLQLAIREAFTRPYLMDELLALSAAHKSTTLGASNEHEALSYCTEATRLQTRALARFNAASSSPPDDDNCVALFLFSTFLGQHVLFDVFSPSQRTDLAAVLDRLVHCLGLHRGIRAIAGTWWSRLRRESSLLFGLPEQLASGTGTPTSSDAESGAECATLLELLRTRSQLAGSAGEPCREAVEVLQRMFDSARLPSTSPDPAGMSTVSTRRFIVIQEWPVRVPAGYVELLEQRQPEALVTLAYYGVLLHRAKEHWALGDAGSYLIRSITRHLGTYWAEWLSWPNAVLDGDGSGGRPDFTPGY